MRAIQPHGTKPELVVRRALRQLGYPGYRLHPKGYPGRPDMERDKEALARLAAAGWDVLVIWECETKDAEALARTLTGFLGAPRTP